MNLNLTKSIAEGRPPNADRVVILLVEDEPCVREITRDVLQSVGYTVIESSGPQEAMKLVSTHSGRIDLLLTDVVMPGMNGADLACHLQRLLPGLPTIFMSGYAESDVFRKVRSIPAALIQKPFTMNALLSQIATSLNNNPANDGAASLSGILAWSPGQ
jgi:two-component system, cell cycle sensor histidine kinase and response regulator CckA